ncbi:ankyrin repeat protein [Nannizzia gypsea CBS 118893]|uniref:Ankyrin repeat protein n=1 Tax=Arthroderma gypseum (strain ATCC MYA-4604 / CBS 118893) TaxID=535722 RepID=E4UXM4_ARTGP|nr:ankyrin repeat protein [Nannizzia gypsea CBS 118893]EFR02758.1 ankyrin repeat protein [Nannizzia gypsea CBS 118893]
MVSTGKGLRHDFHIVATQTLTYAASLPTMRARLHMKSTKKGRGSLSYDFTSKVKVTGGHEVKGGENDQNLYRDSCEMITIDMRHGSESPEDERFHSAISDCVNGGTEAVREYLKTSSEAQLFLHGRDREGKATLICAAEGKSPSMVSLLLEHGADVNAVDLNGRSPLMEAALWGRLDTVKLLLENAADKGLQDTENHSAIDLARPTQRNRRERYTRSGGDLSPLCSREPLVREDTFKRDIDRQSIVHLLGGEGMRSKNVFGSPPMLSRCKDYSFRRSPGSSSIVLQGPIASYPVTTEWKTVACLERGGRFASVAAMSGWSHDQRPQVRVSGRQWTDEVLYISQLVNHTLARDDRDRGHPGQFNACHAEKQLIAYFIDHHIFLPRDITPSSELREKISLVERQHEAFYLYSPTGRELSSLRARVQDLETKLFDADHVSPKEREERKIKALESALRSAEEQFKRLSGRPHGQQILDLERQLDALSQQQARHEKLACMFEKRPPASLSEAVILASSPICNDCLEFKNKANQFFGMSLQLFAAC